MQSKLEYVREAVKEEAVPFEIISDENQEIYKTLSIEATQTKEERLPAFFIIDKDAKVLYVHYVADMIDMPAVEEAVSLI